MVIQIRELEKSKTTKDKISNALKLLGDDPQAVAATLADAGYRGFPSSGMSCPIARYLKDMTQRDDVHVGRGTVFFDDGRIVCATLAVAQFVTQFDDGKFPELLAAPEQDLIWVD